MSNLCVFCDRPVNPNDQAPFDGVLCEKGDHLHTWCAPEVEAWAEQAQIEVRWTVEQRADGFYLLVEPEWMMKALQNNRPYLLGPYPTPECAHAVMDTCDLDEGVN